MGMRYSVVVSVLLALAPVLAGCGTQSEGATDLPSWAPGNPSPEFVRAAKVLKPPLEEAAAEPAKRAEQDRCHRILVPAWEFVGTLSDDQVRTFSSTKELSAPCPSLTAAQCRVLDSFFEVYRKAMQGVPPSDDWPADELAELRRLGARGNLSNVTLVLDVRASGLVRFACVIQRPDGTATPRLPLIGLGTMR